MESSKELLNRITESNNFYLKILKEQIYGYGNAVYIYEEFTMDIFSSFCEHIKTTYQMFFNFDYSKRELFIPLAKSLELLTEIACFGEQNEETICMQLLALKTIKAILNIENSNENQIVQSSKETVVWYDFDTDTPETVYNRLKDYINKNGGYYFLISEMHYDDRMFDIPIYIDYNMTTSVHSRKSIQKLIDNGFPIHSAVISFYDPDRYDTDKSYTLVDYSNKTDNVLYVPLDDFQTELPEADKIAEFVYSAKTKEMQIICQCEAGQNRSAGCAAAILEHFSQLGDSVFNDDRYQPDEMVYFAVLNALERYKNTK